MKKSFLLLSATLSVLPVEAQVLGYFGPDNTSSVGIKHERYGATYRVVSMDAQGRSPYDQARLWWSELPWNGNDKPFVRAAQSINTSARNRAKLVQVATQLRAQANAKPTDALVFFKWMVASWQLSQNQTRREGERWLVPVADRAFRLNFPRSYQYARYTFLVMAFTKPTPALQPLGNRLLKRNPRDQDVRLFQVRVVSSKAFEPQLRPMAQKEALAHLAILRRQNPNNPLADREEGNMWTYLWNFSHQSQQLTNSRSAYQKYLKKLPNAPDKSSVLSSLKSDSQEQELWEWSRSAQIAKAEGRPRPPLPAWFQAKVNAAGKKAG